MRAGEFTTSFLVLWVYRVRGKWSCTYLKKKKSLPKINLTVKIHHRMVFRAKPK